MHITEQPDISQIVKLCCNYHQSLILSFLCMFDIKTVLCFSTQGRLNSKITVTGHLAFFVMFKEQLRFANIIWALLV